MSLKVVWHCFSEDVNKHPLTLDRQPLTNQSQVSLTPKVHCDEPMSSIGGKMTQDNFITKIPELLESWKSGNLEFMP